MGVPLIPPAWLVLSQKTTGASKIFCRLALQRAGGWRVKKNRNRVRIECKRVQTHLKRGTKHIEIFKCDFSAFHRFASFPFEQGQITAAPWLWLNIFGISSLGCPRKVTYSWEQHTYLGYPATQSFDDLKVEFVFQNYVNSQMYKKYTAVVSQSEGIVVHQFLF